MKAFLLFTLLISGQIGLAQQAALTAGGDAEGTGGRASFSIGQVAYVALTSESGLESQGVQQPNANFIACTSDANENGICDDLDAGGCTYPLAPNFDPAATMDNGSCIWPEPCPDASCTGDLNADSFVSVSDLLMLLGAFGTDCIN